MLIGAGAVIATQVMVAVTGTDQFCGGACHSMQWVAKEHKQSVHFANRTGVRAGCHDCHIPHAYPEVLWYKTKAGIRDVIQEARGVISTEEKFKKDRLRLATSVWSEYKRNDSRALVLPTNVTEVRDLRKIGPTTWAFQRLTSLTWDLAGPAAEKRGVPTREYVSSWRQQR